VERCTVRGQQLLEIDRLPSGLVHRGDLERLVRWLAKRLLHRDANVLEVVSVLGLWPPVTRRKRTAPGRSSWLAVAISACGKRQRRS
jgi:hypothetical protein